MSIRTSQKHDALRAAIIEHYGFKNADDAQPGMCRVCAKPVAGRKRYYCSDSCRSEFYSATMHDNAGYVYLRDKGVCACCGLDTDALIRERAEAGAMPSFIGDKLRAALDVVGRRAEELVRAQERLREAQAAAAERAAIEQILEEWKAPNTRDRIWDVDHIIPVERHTDGVEANHPDNLQTLAIPCHKRKTATEDAPALARDRRKRRKHDKHKARMRAKWEIEDDGSNDT